MMFSVIIPAYNAASFIKNSISSVLDQTVQDFEILVVDDGSTDDTKNVMQSIVDNRLVYIDQPNGGVSAARNTGILNAKGDYICFLDADDLWKENHLEEILNLINQYPTASVFLTGHEILLHNGASIVKTCPIVENTLLIDNMFEHIFRHGYFIHTNSIVCKKNAFDVVGLFEVGVKNGEDDDMWYRLFSFFSTAISKAVTTTYVRSNSNATSARVFVHEWVFLRRVNEIVNSSGVSGEKKTSLFCLIEHRKLSFVRYCILNGDKKTAWQQMKTIDKQLVKKKKYIATLLSLIIPTAISKFIVSKRDKQYYSN